MLIKLKKMKNTMVSIAIAATIVTSACQKNDMLNNTSGVNTKNYENKLSIDYSNALLNHNALSTTSAASTIDNSYYIMMFNRNDSLFSQHFYEFCMDMMQNSGVMSTSNGMMGNNRGMMGGNGSKMHGGPMGGIGDMNKMMRYMDSLHLSTGALMNPDYMKTDSLMYNQMNNCNMMSPETDSIVNVYGNMQMLRKNHKTFHGN
jgi:hypothetical protein